MAYFQQRQKYLQKYRYSIQQLLRLAAVPSIQFDLSKFSYEAARAGVIPLLGDCAMSSRKSSTSRIRDCSLGSTSTEDMILYQANPKSQNGREQYTTQLPVRNPIFPPPLEKQKDEGFARFLKTHSSPTHQRVNAGGRIVPIESHPSPPTFRLQTQASVRENESELKITKNNTTPAQGVGGVAQTGDDFNFLYSTSSTSFNNNFRVPESKAAHTTESSTQPISYVDGALSGPNCLPEQRCNTFYPSSYPQPDDFSYHSQYNPYGVEYYQHSVFNDAVQYGDPICFGNHWTNGQHLPQNVLNQQILLAQQSLAYWQHQYTELDQQLKDMDRYRAMNDRSSTMVEQRRTVVQQRSDIKDYISKIKALLGISHRTESSNGSFSGGFNVDAPPYIPHSAQTSMLPPVETTENLKRYLGDKSSQIKPPTPGVRRVIPIISPSPVTERVEDSSNQYANQSIKVCGPVDEWGVQLGQAPPELEREQSAMSEKLTRYSSSFSEEDKNSTRSGGGADMTRPNSFAQQICEDNRQELETSTEDKAGNIGRSPSLQTQSAYAKLLDAMREPKGKFTRVQVQGHWMDIEGQGLRLHPSPTMESWERHYWAAHSNREEETSLRQPQTVDSALLDEHSQCLEGHSQMLSECDKENVTIAAPNHQRAATDAIFVPCDAFGDQKSFNRRGTQSLRGSKAISSSHSTHVLREVYGRNSNELSPSHRNSIPPAKRTDGGDRNGGNFEATTVPQHCYLTDYSAQFDGLDVKGHSLVSVQNVHATGHVPHNLDGSTDGGRNARVTLTMMNKTRSPRLLHRPTAQGTIWYGPYCREAIEKALENDWKMGPKYTIN